jgi:hypothetical protein
MCFEKLLLNYPTSLSIYLIIEILAVDNQECSVCTESVKVLDCLVNFHLISAEIWTANGMEAAQITVGDGRAIAQAVSRRLPTAAARVQTWVWSCGIL